MDPLRPYERLRSQEVSQQCPKKNQMASPKENHVNFRRGTSYWCTADSTITIITKLALLLLKSVQSSNNLPSISGPEQRKRNKSRLDNIPSSQTPTVCATVP